MNMVRVTLRIGETVRVDLDQPQALAAALVVPPGSGTLPTTPSAPAVPPGPA
jgi:hypothetical protein